MIEVQIAEMMDTGAHFGHQTKRWNPKMRPYIYGARSGVHIIDLQQTKELAAQALQFITDSVARGLNVLFVGTKQQSREIVRDNAQRAQMFYVNDRWMGGTLTNFNTIKKSIDMLIDLETKRANNDFEGYTKKELLDIDRKIIKLEASLGGIKALKRIPDILFIIDPKQENIAVKEANKLGLPIVAITDTNCDPDPIDHVIPANDDAISSITYFTVKVADACVLGLEKREQNAQNESRSEARGERRAPRPRRSVKGEEAGKEAGKSYVSKAVRDSAFEGDAKEGYSAQAEVAVISPATPNLDDQVLQHAAKG